MAFKRQTLQELLKANPTVEHVEVWEDDPDAVAAYCAVGAAMGGRVHVVAHGLPDMLAAAAASAAATAEAGEGAPSTSTATATAASASGLALSRFLARRGRVRTAEFDAHAEAGLLRLLRAYRDLLLQLLTPPIPSGAGASAEGSEAGRDRRRGVSDAALRRLSMVFGSFPLGRATDDLDVLLLAPDAYDSADLVTLVKSHLEQTGIPLVHAAPDARCV